jgi:AraC-like DNA-binding protein
MHYFDDLTFIAWDYDENHTKWYDITMEHYAINLASRGHLHFLDVRGKTVRIESPVFYWTFPGIRYQYGCSDRSPWAHHWIAFKGPRVEQFIQKGLLPRITEKNWKSIKEIDRLKRDFHILLDYLNGQSYGTARAIHLLEGLLLQIQEQDSIAAPHAPHYEELHKLKDSIDSAPEEEWNFFSIAHTFCISYSSFRRLFHNCLRMAPQAYVINARLNKAASQLRTGTTAIKVAASRAGIEDVYYFSKLFKKKFGVTPSQYRRLFLAGQDLTNPK